LKSRGLECAGADGTLQRPFSDEIFASPANTTRLVCLAASYKVRHVHWPHALGLNRKQKRFGLVGACVDRAATLDEIG
jgi:hypothetical protein